MNETLIVLGLTKRQFNFYAEKLAKSSIRTSVFYEPDLNNEITSLACIIEFEKDCKIFKRLKLLGKR
jgi:hypothetical protein